MQLAGLRVGLLLRCWSVKLIRELFGLLSAKGLLNKPASFAAGVAGEAFGLHLGLSHW